MHLPIKILYSLLLKPGGKYPDIHLIAIIIMLIILDIIFYLLNMSLKN